MINTLPLSITLKRNNQSLQTHDKEQAILIVEKTIISSTSQAINISRRILKITSVPSCEDRRIKIISKQSRYSNSEKEEVVIIKLSSLRKRKT